MDGEHERGQVEAVLRRQEPVECPGAFAAVDDAQCLGLGGQPLRQRLPAQPPCTGKGHAAEVLVEIGGAGAELLYGQGRDKRPERSVSWVSNKQHTFVSSFVLKP